MTRYPLSDSIQDQRTWRVSSASFIDPEQTIAAFSSAVGPSARIVLRASGARVKDLLHAFDPACPVAASATCRLIRIPAPSGPSVQVRAWVYLFVSPRSYTGEDLLELHLPGNPLLARWALEAMIVAGARHAEPGEFTARAYFNGRLDLAQAEGVAALVSAQNQAQLDAARQLIHGELATRLRPAMDALAQALALVEADIDFSDQDVSFLPLDELRRRIGAIDQQLAAILDNSARFGPLGHEPTIVLAGRPNAGKSTLLNALAGQDRAIVSPVAGTTRDALSAPVALAHGMVRLVDIAGLDADPAHPPTALHGQMQQRAQVEIARADVVVLVQDSTDPNPPLSLQRSADVSVLTKAELSDALPCLDALRISAITGQGMAALREALDRAAFGQRDSAWPLAINARHVAAIEQCRFTLKTARATIDGGQAELIALELRDALDQLGVILGVVSPDDVLGKIFATFCIGK